MLSYFLPLSGFILKHEDAQDFFFLLHCCSSRSRAGVKSLEKKSDMAVVQLQAEQQVFKSQKAEWNT